MDQFFLVVGRINTLLPLLGVLVAAVVFASLTLFSGGGGNRARDGAVQVVDPASPSGKPVYLGLERFEHIAGTDTDLMLLTAQGSSGKLEMSSGSRSETRNVLFISGRDKTPRWLFPTQAQVVFGVSQLRDEAAAPQRQPTLALYLEFAAKDSNGDGLLDTADVSTIALAKPDGRGLVEVLHEVTRVLSQEVVDARQLVLVYQVGKSIRHARFDLVTLAMESEREIVNVPDQL